MWSSRLRSRSSIRTARDMLGSALPSTASTPPCPAGVRSPTASATSRTQRGVTAQHGNRPGSLSSRQNLVVAHRAIYFAGETNVISLAWPCKRVSKSLSHRRHRAGRGIVDRVHAG
ncbi:hypothetical protein COCON_G00173500 [Conger conger]|uniref:Uncharacterized protein n=1 Tax=Conger conger TaxID=82655 RepID=A0A9Q1D4P2_CONCO|nr:hypothetical protein COCON_G00173500 [Conger conger]